MLMRHLRGRAETRRPQQFSWGLVCLIGAADEQQVTMASASEGKLSIDQLAHDESGDNRCCKYRH